MTVKNMKILFPRFQFGGKITMQRSLSRLSEKAIGARLALQGCENLGPKRIQCISGGGTGGKEKALVLSGCRTTRGKELAFLHRPLRYRLVLSKKQLVPRFQVVRRK